jgi:hypothetical protein
MAGALAKSLVVFAILAPALTAQRLVDHYDGAHAGDWFGWVVTSIGDADGDGVPDFAAGSLYGDDPSFDCGSVDLWSGATGKLLIHLRGENASDKFGASVAGLGDVDADGAADYAVGAPGYDTSSQADAGRTYAYSGRTGLLIWTLDGDAVDAQYGDAFVAAGDVDGDGIGDLLAGEAFASGSFPGAGEIAVISGLDGTELFTIDGAAAGDALGDFVAGVGDLDGDLVPDLGAGARGADVNGVDSGAVFVYSGSDGHLLHEFDGESAGDWCSRVAGLGDVDRDGVPDVGVAPLLATGVRVFSGRDGSLLFRADTGKYEALDLAGAGDVNGDGHADVLCATHLPVGDEMARVVSGRTGNELYTYRDDATTDFLTLGTASLGDLDGDGFSEAALGVPIDLANVATFPGLVDVFAGNDLWLDASPKLAPAGATLTLRTREGPAGAPVLLVAVAIDDVPAFLPLVVGSFDASETLALASTVPSGLSGHTATFRAYALVAPHRVADSGDERVVFE